MEPSEHSRQPHLIVKLVYRSTHSNYECQLRDFNIRCKKRMCQLKTGIIPNPLGGGARQLLGAY